MDTESHQRIALTPCHPLFAATVEGIDLRDPLDEAVFAEILAAFDEYSVLVFPGQDIDDDQQVAFSQRFGSLEIMIRGALGEASVVAGISNVDPVTDTILAPGDPKLLRQFSNELWHTDSSFKPIPALASLLHAREVPPVGGDTSFACMRAAYAALDPERRGLCDGLVAEHSFAYSRSLTVDRDFLTEEQKAEVPPVPQALVVRNPRNRRPSLYVASHASHVIGWPVGAGRVFLDGLIEHATRPEFVYVHRWRAGDLVMWDNRATMHRGSAFDYAGHRRIMHRTTVAGSQPTIARSAVSVARDFAVANAP